jgi:NADP-dependent 3-hydroxy acid dehydrogenase YdfG
MKIDNSTVFFITGAGSGFGYECSRFFLSEYGSKIVMCDINWTEEAI